MKKEQAGPKGPAAPSCTVDQAAALLDAVLARQIQELRRLIAHHAQQEELARQHGDTRLARQIRLNTERLEMKLRACFYQRRDYVAQHALLRGSAKQRQRAARPRPSRRPAIRLRIEAMMHAERAAGADFKSFMRRWEADAIDGLRLTETSLGVYLIDDENAVGVAGEYRRGTLQSYYSLAG